jgi:hypothetical protein
MRLIKTPLFSLKRKRKIRGNVDIIKNVNGKRVYFKNISTSLFLTRKIIKEKIRNMKIDIEKSKKYGIRRSGKYKNL